LNDIDRMLKEESELDDRVCKLSAYIDSKQFQELSDEDRNLLNLQLDAMQLYTTILGMRVFNIQDEEDDQC
jgi:hypothetical protein